MLEPQLLIGQFVTRFAGQAMVTFNHLLASPGWNDRVMAAGNLHGIRADWRT